MNSQIQQELGRPRDGRSILELLRPRPTRVKRRGSFSRRQFLQGGAVGAVAIGAMVARARSVRAGERRRRLVDVVAHRLDVPRGELDPGLQALINHTSFGFTRESYDDAVLMGYDAFLEQQLDYESIDDSVMDGRLAAYPTLSMSSQEIYDNFEQNRIVPVLELIEATIERSIYSKRQLYERMVEFWTYHFNIDILKDFDVFLKTADDRDVIRRHAMSTFPELLNASARSGAMLFYLDNFTNVVGHAQENYARELMELHTLGVNGGFTQMDVEEVARALTGWTLAGTTNPLGLGTFAFFEPNHDFGAKTVLGQFIPAGGGESDGQTVLDILVNHPSTARFIARKLCVHFLGYDPPEDIIESVKATYLATGGDIKAMLRVILQENVLTFLTTPKFKRPFHLTASALRATNADVTNTRFLTVHLLAMGHLPFIWPTPDGYPDTLTAWAGGLLSRWGLAAGAFDPAVPDVTIDTQALIESEGGDQPGQQAAAIDRIMTGGTLSQEEVTLLQDFFDNVPAATLDETFTLAASIPGFQWY